MRAASLDRRVRKEAVLLVREARTAVAKKPGLKGKAGDLESVTSTVEKALVASDLKTVRYHLPVLDAIVDEVVARPPKSSSRDYVESIGAAVLIALALRAFVIEAFKIPSSSMYPTLEIGDHIFVNKFLYGLRIPTLLAMGTSELSTKKFVLLNLLNSVVWTCLFVFGGYFFGDFFTSVMGDVRQYEKEIVIGIGAIALIVWAVSIIRNRIEYN